MRRPNRVHAFQRSYLCLILVVILSFAFVTQAIATSSDTIAIDRYDSVAPGGEDSKPSQPDDEEPRTPQVSKEEIEIQQFNGQTLDTIIFIIGILAGAMMTLQMLFFCVSKIYPSLNSLLEKLSVIGITGYEDGYVFPTFKFLLLGVLAFLCVTGLLKSAVLWILSWFAFIIS